MKDFITIELQDELEQTIDCSIAKIITIGEKEYAVLLTFNGLDHEYSFLSIVDIGNNVIELHDIVYPEEFELVRNHYYSNLEKTP